MPRALSVRHSQKGPFSGLESIKGNTGDNIEHILAWPFFPLAITNRRVNCAVVPKQQQAITDKWVVPAEAAPAETSLSLLLFNAGMDPAATSEALANVGKLKTPKKDLSAESQMQNGVNAAYWGYKVFQGLRVCTRTSSLRRTHSRTNAESRRSLAFFYAHTMHRVP